MSLLPFCHPFSLAFDFDRGFSCRDAAVREFEKWHGWSGSDPFPRNCTTEAQRRANCTTDFGSAGARTWADLQTVVDGNAGTSVNGLDVDKTAFFINLGDEIALGTPDSVLVNQSNLNRAFEAWLEAHKIPAAVAGCAPYVGCVYNTSLLAVAEGPAAAASFYYSKRFAHDFGIYNSSYGGKGPSYHNITDT